MENDAQADNTELFKIKTEGSLLKVYRTPTLFTSPTLTPSITMLKDTPFLLIPNANSFSIFSLQSLKLQFLSQSFSNISSIVQSNAFVYVSADNFIYKTVRGEVIAKYEVENAISMVKFGSYLVLNTGKELVVFECNDEEFNLDFLNIDCSKTANKDEEAFKELYRLKFEVNIKIILHPNTYVNKILIIFENGSAELYNLSSKKKIYNYKFGKVSCAVQTDILDVIALGMEDGKITVYNLKKGRNVLEILEFVGKSIKNLSFKEKFATVVTDALMIYNLELHRIMYVKKPAYSGLIVNDSTALVVTKSSVELINLDDFTILKTRKILNENIKSILSYSKTELLLVSEEHIYKMNIYKDEANRFLNTKTQISLVALETNGVHKSNSTSLVNSEIGSNSLYNSNILMFGDNQLSYIDRELKFHKFIPFKGKFMKIFKDFVLLATTNKVIVMNLKSKRVICSMKSQDNAYSGEIENDSFTILYSDSIKSYNFDCELLFNYKFDQSITGGTIAKNGNLYFILKENIGLQVLSRDCNNDISRVFDVKKYAFNNRLLVGIRDETIKIFDISTGALIDTIVTNKQLIDVVLLDDFKFVAVLDSNSDLHLLSNQSHFNSIVNTKTTGYSTAQLTIPVIKKESSFYKDLVVHKNFNTSTADVDMIIKAMNKDEVSQITKLIKDNLQNDFFGTQKILSKLLLYKSKYLDVDDLKEIYLDVEIKLKELEDNVLTSIGYLNLDKNKLL